MALIMLNEEEHNWTEAWLFTPYVNDVAALTLHHMHAFQSQYWLCFHWVALHHILHRSNLNKNVSVEKDLIKFVLFMSDNIA